MTGGVFLADRRNLWPLIVAHGMVDTVGLTLIRIGAGARLAHDRPRLPLPRSRV